MAPCAELAHFRRADGLQRLTILVTLVVDRGDHEPHRNTHVDQSGLRQLQARLDRLGHRVGDAKLVSSRAWLASRARATMVRSLLRCRAAATMSSDPSTAPIVTNQLRAPWRYAANQKLALRRVTPIDVGAQRAELLHQTRAGLDGKKIDRMRPQHLAHHLANAAIATMMALPIAPSSSGAWRFFEFGIGLGLCRGSKAAKPAIGGMTNIDKVDSDQGVRTDLRAKAPRSPKRWQSRPKQIHRQAPASMPFLKRPSR